MNLMSYINTGTVPDNVKYNKALSYDFDYFAFTKSTKTLFSIRQLLNYKELDCSADCLILIRSIYENHVMSRYVRENIDNQDMIKEVVDDFIQAPLGVSFDYMINVRSQVYTKDDNKKVGTIKLPGKVKMGKENDYHTL